MLISCSTLMHLIAGDFSLNFAEDEVAQDQILSVFDANHYSDIAPIIPPARHATAPTLLA
jgi:hypothetical protein